MTGSSESSGRLGKLTDRTVQNVVQGIRDDAFLNAADEHLRTLTPGGVVCVLVVEIQRLEALASIHGAAICTEVLEIGETRIREAVQARHLATRIAAKGFALVFRQSTLAGPVAAIARRIQARFEEPIPTSIGGLPVSVSVGAAIAEADRAHSVSPHTLLAQAQAAVEVAGRQNPDRIAEFDRPMRHEAIETYRTEQELRRALKNRSLSVNYQPIISLASGRVVGVEALARWMDPRFGMIPPSMFIPVAESCGLINELGRVVLGDAVSQGARWNSAGPVDTTITVNLSRHQLHDPSLVATVRSLLESHGLRNSRLCLEITESVVMGNIESSMGILRQLKDLGVVLAIDDFGTGHSSLSYLNQLPVDILKIDQSFVHSLDRRDERLITKAVINLAHTLGMTTIAEGVETLEQVETLLDLDCDMVQGFLLQRPCTSDDLSFGDVDFEAIEHEHRHAAMAGSVPTAP